MSKEEIMLAKIKSAFIFANEQGVPYETTFAFVTNDFSKFDGKNGRRFAEIGRIIKNAFMNESLGYKQVSKFIKSQNIDIIKMVEEEKMKGEKKTMKEDEEEIIDVDSTIVEESTVEEPDVEETEVGSEEPTAEDDLEYEEQQPTKEGNELEKKINALCEKIAQEKSPLKRHFNQFLVKQLQAKIDREIDKARIKAEYDLKRDELSSGKKEEEEELESRIARLTKKQRLLKQILRADQEYDYKSKDFMYPKEYMKDKGGIDGIIEKLEKSSDEDTREAASRMRSMKATREELNKINSEIKDVRENLENLENDHNIQANKLGKEEKSLIVKKTGPFNAIKGWFKNAITEIKGYFKEKKENRNDRADFKASRNDALDELKEKMEEDLARITEEYEKKKEDLMAKYEKEEKKHAQDKSRERLRAFQAESGIKVSPEQLQNNEQETDEQNQPIEQEEEQEQDEDLTQE